MSIDQISGANQTAQGITFVKVDRAAPAVVSQKSDMPIIRGKATEPGKITAATQRGHRCVDHRGNSPARNILSKEPNVGIRVEIAFE